MSGNGQVCRYLLSYVEAPWKDKPYLERGEWFEKDKAILNIPFPNLPYLIDGNLKLSETSALIRYIPRRWGHPELLGKTMVDQYTVDLYLGVLQDVWAAVSPLIFAAEWQELKEAALGKFRPLLAGLEKAIEGEWALKYLTVVDFRLADFIALVVAIYPEEAGSFKQLLTIKERVYNLPEIKKYRESEGAIIALVPRHSTIPA